MTDHWPGLALGDSRWLAVAIGLGLLSLALIAWAYTRAEGSGRVRVACALLKAFGLGALILALVDPLLTGSKAKKGANAFAVVADDSQSLQIRDAGSPRSRGDWARDRLGKGQAWSTRLAQDFDVRRYAFDAHLRAVEGFDGLAFDGPASALGPSLAALGRRFRGLPLAGVLLFSDGNRTDLGPIDLAGLPPIYPVAPPSTGVARDVGIAHVTASQTNFEAAPVVLRVDASSVGLGDGPIVAAVVDEAGKVVDRQEARAEGPGRPASFRFQFRPERSGISFYTVRAFAGSAEQPGSPGSFDPAASGEQTLANNERLVVVDRGGGPFRVLYLSGRPNWEYKFLRRALADDDQVGLVGLIRIARRVARFDFQASGSRTTSPLFNGFDNVDADGSDRADQPVLVRLNTLDDAELRDGFPKAAAELFRYHAIIIDDLEAGFFTADQMALVREFVARRGGGLLMLGGPDSFADGRYDRTPIGDLLPTYLDRFPVGAAAAGAGATPGSGWSLHLTREGWLQPWVRLETTEDRERARLAALPPHRILSRVGSLKPGASVLAEVRDDRGGVAPALVAQPFGAGRVAALLVGDLWRRALRRDPGPDSDLDRSWRQAVRWLVGDVPGRVAVAVRHRSEVDPGPEAANGPASAVAIAVRVKDAEFRPLENARVRLKVTLPDHSDLTLDAAAEGREPGLYAASYVPKAPGPYRVEATATAPDGSPVGTREAGWAAQPSADEFARLEPDRAALEDLARRTGGAVVEGDQLDRWAASLASRAAPINEPWTAPLWHEPIYFALALAALIAEWAVRRIHGLA